MPYGRLDVFWPDGRFETYPLEGSSISVGRSTGNTIVLETDSISRYHFSLTRDPDADDVMLTDLDSANGTYIDGVRIPTSTPRPLRGGEELQIGEMRLIYHMSDDSPTQPITPIDASTLNVQIEEDNLGLSLEGPNQSIPPGAHISAVLNITNTGKENRLLHVDVTGLPPGWTRIDRREIDVDPGETASVVINFKPARRSDSRPGPYPVTVKVISDTTTLQLETQLRVLPYSGFGMALEQRRISPNQRFHLHIHNQGSDNLPLSISGRSLNGALTFEIPSARVTLTAGQRMIIKGEAKPLRRVLVGEPREHGFDVIVRSHDASGFLAAVRGYVVEKPLLPTWALTAGVAGISALALVIIIALIVLLGGPSTPVINSFEVSSSRIERGDTLQLFWNVADAKDIVLNVNGRPLAAPLDASSTSINLPTDDLSGEVSLELIAINGSEQVSAQQSVTIFTPIVVNNFSTQPPALVRYVVQSLTISWDVSGAVRVTLDGLQNFTTTPLAAEYSATETLSDLAGILLEPLTLTLHAEADDGTTSDQILVVEVTNPECRAPQADVPLHLGPNAAHQVVGTVPENVTVVVDAQDESGQWLRVQLPGGIQGWGDRSELVCASNFSVDNLRKELNVPPPPTSAPTLPPTLMPVPTQTPEGTPVVNG